MAVLHAPVSLALARPARALPVSRREQEWAYEPKFDGWRAVLFTADGVVQSRRDSDLAARFPELTRAATQLGDVVVDGEIVALRGGKLDFGALTSSPRSRAAAGVVIYLVVFDLLADDVTDLRPRPYRLRRAQLEQLFAGVAPPLQLAPSTTDRTTALGWMQVDASAVGIEGCVAKRTDSTYAAGRTNTWVKVRRMVVVDAVIVGVTGPPRHPDEVVLARPDATGQLHRIGLSQPLARKLRDEVGQRVRLTGEPAVRVSTGVFGQRGQTEYLPTVPELMVEVEAEAAVMEFGNRLRPRVHRLRLDLTPDPSAIRPG